MTQNNVTIIKQGNGTRFMFSGSHSSKHFIICQVCSKFIIKVIFYKKTTVYTCHPVLDKEFIPVTAKAVDWNWLTFSTGRLRSCMPASTSTCEEICQQDRKFKTLISYSVFIVHRF